ncbi:MAG: FliH/SctL family protein, partial [FCB group bacterium]
MSQVYIKFPKPLQRVEIIPQKDLKDKDISSYIPGELSRQGIGSLFNDNSDYDYSQEKQIIDVFTQEILITHTNEPLEISLDKLSEQQIPVSNAKFQIDEAYEKGFSDGVESVKAEMEANLEQAKHFENLVNEFKHQYIQELNKLEESLVSLSIMVAEHIINRELANNSNMIIEQTRKAIHALDD